MSRDAHDPAWYAAHADAFGWGPRTAVVDPERARLLERWATGRVLDVGCATGNYVDHLAERGIEAVGVDHAEDLVAWARRHRRGTFEVADARSLPYETDAFDTVCAFDLLEHVDDVGVLAELQRVARSRVLLVVPQVTPPELYDAGLLFRHHEDPSHRRYYTEEDLLGLVETAGLRPLAVEGLAPVDWNGLLLRTVGHARPRAEPWIHRALFKLLRHARVKRYPREWFAACSV